MESLYGKGIMQISDYEIDEVAEVNRRLSDCYFTMPHGESANGATLTQFPTKTASCFEELSRQSGGNLFG